MTHPRQRRRPLLPSDATDRTAIDYAFVPVGREILAYLHYTVTCDRTVEFFWHSVIFHFRENLQRIVSLTEVEEKLELFWTYSHAPDRANKHWRDDLCRGIDAFPRLDKEKIDWVQARVYELEECDSQNAHRMLRSTRHPWPVRAVSKRRADASKRQERGKALRIAIAKSASESKQSFSLNVPFSASKQHQHRARRDDESGPGETSDQDIDAEAYSDSLKSSNQRCSSVTTEAAIDADLASFQSELANGHVCQNCAQVHTDVAQLRSDLQTAESRVLELEVELDELRLRESESKSLWKISCADLEELKRQNKHLQAEDGTKGTSSDAIKRNVKLRMDHDKLQKRCDLLQVESSVQFASDKWSLFEDQNVREVQRDIDELQSDLRRFMQGFDSMFSQPEHDIVKQSPLATLFRELLASDVNNLGETRTSTPDLSRFKLRVILISLVSAALRTWIFSADVQGLFTNNGIAYTKLADILAGLGGESGERLKFAAHKSLCENDTETKDGIISERARYYSRRFFNSIKPLLEAHEIDAITYETETRHLTEIFTTALSIKVRLLLTTDLYECLSPPPGTSFNDYWMERWVGEHCSRPSTGPGQEVAITVFPALFRFGVNHRSFTFNRFQPRDTILDAGRRERLSKAIVVTR